MSDLVLSAGADPMGAAIYDFHQNASADVLRVFSSQFDEDEIPVADLFREFEEMPELEQYALEIADGEILDVGAGSRTDKQRRKCKEFSNIFHNYRRCFRM